ncbi:hypothetical protein FKM82_029093 [Ascaphus truei]
MVLVEQGQRPKLIGEDAAARDQRVQSIEPAVEEGRSYDRPTMMDEDEENLQKALALSRQQIDMEDEEADLRRAIQLSMQGSVHGLKICLNKDCYCMLLPSSNTL